MYVSIGYWKRSALGEELSIGMLLAIRSALGPAIPHVGGLSSAGTPENPRRAARRGPACRELHVYYGACMTSRGS